MGCLCLGHSGLECDEPAIPLSPRGGLKGILVIPNLQSEVKNIPFEEIGRLALCRRSGVKPGH